MLFLALSSGNLHHFFVALEELKLIARWWWYGFVKNRDKSLFFAKSRTRGRCPVKKFFWTVCFLLWQIYPSGNRRNIVSGHKSKRQNMDLNYARTQLKIEKDGFDLCPDTSQNWKRWIYLSGLRTQVKIEKDGFICPLRTHLRTNVRTRQDKNFNCVRTQVKIAKDGNYVWWINLSSTVIIKAYSSKISSPAPLALCTQEFMRVSTNRLNYRAMCTFKQLCFAHITFAAWHFKPLVLFHENKVMAITQKSIRF